MLVGPAVNGFDFDTSQGFTIWFASRFGASIEDPPVRERVIINPLP